MPVAGVAHHRLARGGPAVGKAQMENHIVQARLEDLQHLLTRDTTAAQGFLVGLFRANPILVSIAGLSLLIGGAAFATGGHRIYPGGAGLDMFKGRVAGIPIGESLIPETYWVLQRLKMLDKLRASHFVKKYSVQFVNASGSASGQSISISSRPP